MKNWLLVDRDYLRIPTKNKAPIRKDWSIPINHYYKEPKNTLQLLKEYGEYGVRLGLFVKENYHLGALIFRKPNDNLEKIILMATFSERIKNLESRIENLLIILETAEKELDQIESKSRKKIQLKEKELEEWQEKVEVLQQENIKIKKELRDKVDELEKQNNLPKTEKQEKINHLLMENSRELDKLDKLLYNERNHYRLIRNKLINKLCEDCSLCGEKERLIEEKGQTTRILEARASNLSALVNVGIATTTLLFFLFLFTAHAYIKKLKKTEKKQSNN